MAGIQHTLLTLFSVICITAKVEAGKNVLMIIVDDLRPEIGAFLNTDNALYPNIKTPNIDGLATKSIKFRNAHTQWTTCTPSRASFLTGRRPDTTNVTSNGENFRDPYKLGSSVITLPQHFKDQGYKTYSIGKVFHGHLDENYSWDEVMQPQNERYWHQQQFNSVSWGMADTVGHNRLLPDQEILEAAQEKLSQVGSDPFFLAVGFKRTHLPFVCPKEFYDMYPEADINLPDHPSVAVHYPEVAWNGWLDMSGYNDISSYDNSYGNSLPDDKTKDLRRAYYACVSYIDDLIGKLLLTLEEESLQDDTVIMFMSDHGFHLGEQSMWAKGTLVTLDTHVPMMLRVPGLTDNGLATNAYVENVDVFPTLVEAAEVDPVPQCPDTNQPDLCHEGMSAFRFIANTRANSKRWVLTQFSRSYQRVHYMGYSMRNSRYRYTRWVEHNNGYPIMDPPFAEELYDHNAGETLTFEGTDYFIDNEYYDPDENINQAGNANYTSVKTQLYNRLLRGYKAAMPSDAL